MKNITYVTKRVKLDFDNDVSLNEIDFTGINEKYRIEDELIVINIDGDYLYASFPCTLRGKSSGEYTLAPKKKRAY